MGINDIKTLDDIRRQLRVNWGAITSFQSQLYSITGDIQEIISLIGDITAGITQLSLFTDEMRRLYKGESNKVSEMMEEFECYSKEVKTE